MTMCKNAVSHNCRAILLTTMWSAKENPIFEEREKGLREGWMKGMPGMPVVRYDRSYSLTWNIIHYALGMGGPGGFETLIFEQ